MSHAASTLKQKDRAVLDFEAAWWQYPSPKDQAIRDYLEMSATRYYQALRRLMDDPVALAYSPLVVRRLRRMRDERLDQIARRVQS